MTAIDRTERGVALVVVFFVLVIILAGGLAAIALTSGELAGTQGFRSRALTEACANAAADHIRTLLPANPSDPLPTIVTGSVTVNNVTLTYRTGHISGTAPAVEVVPGDYFDVSQTMQGENATNTGMLVSSVKVYRVTATCTAPGGSVQEVQLVVKRGVAAGG